MRRSSPIFALFRGGIIGYFFVKLVLNLEPVVEEEISLKQTYISYLQPLWSFGLFEQNLIMQF